MEDEQVILRRELYGDEELVTCALCEQAVTRQSAHLVPGAEVGVADAQYLYLCDACHRDIHKAEPVEPEIWE
jgi:hypothetical protein